MNITLEDLLNREYLKKDYFSYYPNDTEEQFKNEIKRLFSDWDKHPYDCKCLICV